MLYVTSPNHYYFVIDTSVDVDTAALTEKGCLIHSSQEVMYDHVAEALNLDKEDEVRGHDLLLRKLNNERICVDDRGAYETVNAPSIEDFIVHYTL